MPPRFVVIATPVEDGIDWAGTAGHALMSLINGFACNMHVPSNLTDEVYDTFTTIQNVVPGVPKPQGISAYMLMAGIATAAIRIVFVKVRASMILKLYGQSRAINKHL